MGKRHDAIGIKQVVRLEWYDYALDLLLEGHPPKEIRSQLDAFIRERMQSGGYGDRGEQTYPKAVTQIMKCWITPERELAPLRDTALQHAKTLRRELRIVLHWGVTMAAYPFWYQVAEQVGRLLNLQDTITQNQVRLRIFEAIGERTTVERSARRVVRSYVAWGALKDTDTKGCYKKNKPLIIDDSNLAIFLFEAALYAIPDGKSPLKKINSSPAFFLFQLPTLSGDYISRYQDRIDIIRYSLDDELLQLK